MASDMMYFAEFVPTRLGQIEAFVRQYCYENGVSLRVVKDGWINQTRYFYMDGPQEGIDRVKMSINATLRYNGL